MLCADTPLLGNTETASAAGTNGQRCFQSFSWHFKPNYIWWPETYGNKS